MANIIDISTKVPTLRTAKAVGGIALNKVCYDALVKGRLTKGDALTIAKVAGISAAKQTSSILPLCHNINIDKVEIKLQPFSREDNTEFSAQFGDGVAIETTTTGVAKTGFEMECLLATQVAALTIYDMTKGLGYGSYLLPSILLEKTGGKSDRNFTTTSNGDDELAHNPGPRLSDYVYGRRIVHPNFKLPPLPYGEDELTVGGISETTVKSHHKGHYQGYINKMNVLLEELNDPKLKEKTLEELLITPNLPDNLYNAIAQSYNHMLYFHVMQPIESRVLGWASHKPDEYHEELKLAIEKEWQSFDNFKNEFSEVAVNHFGSGWIWLVQNADTRRLEIMSTHDAICPDLTRYQPLLVLDVWEHAYYLDYKGKRADYVQKWWDLVNWHIVFERMINN